MYYMYAASGSAVYTPLVVQFLEQYCQCCTHRETNKQTNKQTNTHTHSIKEHTKIQTKSNIFRKELKPQSLWKQENNRCYMAMAECQVMDQLYWLLRNSHSPNPPHPHVALNERESHHQPLHYLQMNNNFVYDNESSKCHRMEVNMSFCHHCVLTWQNTYIYALYNRTVYWMYMYTLYV